MATDKLITELRQRFGVNFEDLRATLPRHERWEEDEDYRYRRRNASAIRGHVFHHSESSRATTWKSVADFHIGPRRDWPGIAYTLGVRLYGGVVKVALLNDLETISYHVGDNNDIFDSVCLMGSFENEHPLPSEIGALREVVAALDAALGRVLPLEPHHKYRPTTCPGKLAAALPTLRNTPRFTKEQYGKTAYWLEDLARKRRAAGEQATHDIIVQTALPPVYQRRDT